MKIALFYHSLLSDWGNRYAHFLRGIAAELIVRDNEVTVFEPADAWSMQNLLHDRGANAVLDFHNVYPSLLCWRYKDLDCDEALAGVDLVIVHEWNSPGLVRRLGEYRKKHKSFRLLFHDTHHRAVTNPSAMAEYDLTHYDGVLASGTILRDIYLANNWTQHAWSWHEAADTRVFKPMPEVGKERDLIWAGNWADEERKEDLQEYLINPAKDLHLCAAAYGVQYPPDAVREFTKAGFEYGGWLPNFQLPREFARSRVTVDVPRGPLIRALPGIPTIRLFEALACGIPLICSPWSDVDGLFAPGTDFLVAHDGAEMRQMLRAVLNEPYLAESLVRNGRNRILKHHTCAHRVDELMDIYHELKASRPRRKAVLAA